MNLDTSHLRTFVTVAELKSFSKASKRLHRVQSAISQQIQKLETQVGETLFTRSTSKVELTSKGELLLNYAVQILNLNDKALYKLKEQKLTGRLKVGTSDTYASCFFRDLLRLSTELYPDIEIEIQCGYSKDIWALYEQGKLDLVLTQSCPSEINHEVLHIEPLKWVCSKTSNVYNKRPIPLALFSEGCGDRDIALRALNIKNIDYRINFISTSHAGILAAISSGTCVTAMLVSTIDSSFKILNEEDGYPQLASLELSIAYRDQAEDQPSHLFAQLVRDYFNHQKALKIA